MKRGDEGEGMGGRREKGSFWQFVILPMSDALAFFTQSRLEEDQGI